MSTPNPHRNPAKDRLLAGGVALGMLVRLGRSGDIVRVAKTSGHDFLFLDTQHAIYDLETIGHIAQASLSSGVATLVRARGVGDPDVGPLLDSGVSGIVFPDVHTAADARRAVAVSKFAPVGRRSIGGASPFFDFAPVPVAEVVSRLNEHTLVVCMVESAEGVANLEEIAAVPGVDVVHIGSNDLLLDLGRPGQFDDPELADVFRRVIAATAANGIYAGCGGIRDVARQRELIGQGVRLLTTQSDLVFVLAAATRWVDGVRGAAPGTPAQP